MQTTNILCCLTLACLLVTTSPVAGFAQSGASMVSKPSSFKVAVVPSKTATEFKLYVFNPGHKKINLEIIHSEKGLVTETNFTDEQFNCRYDFSEAEDGTYEIKLYSGKERYVKKIALNATTKRNIVMIE